ncbi:MAG TPA: hypothetical protein EYP14_14415 [Planctomycetaceae bacterium]|nr:hypothetical protein [Planctomycetaceae bacterium]
MFKMRRVRSTPNAVRRTQEKDGEMKLITSVKEMQRYVRHNYRKWRRIGLVPTMGYFHDGHMMLIREARKRCDRLVVSIFVNPLQFGRGSDFATYPRNLKRDLAIAKDLKVNVVFAPSSDELYPEDYSTFVEEDRLSKKLCGPYRPGHFKGVARASRLPNAPGFCHLCFLLARL